MHDDSRLVFGRERLGRFEPKLVFAQQALFDADELIPTAGVQLDGVRKTIFQFAE
jgi:hypothetical protein